MKYRKLPIEVEAYQMTEDTITKMYDWPVWLNDAWNKECNTQGSLQQDGLRLEISTLEGFHEVSMGDWIIQGVEGEIYPCKPEIFKKTYETV